MELATEFGDLDRVKAKLAALRDKRRTIEARLRGTTQLPDLSELEAAIEPYVTNLRAELEGDPDSCRRAFQRLLGGERMRVAEDAERGFRVEGLFYLDLDAENPRERGSRGSQVAGARFDTDEPTVDLHWAA